LDGFPNGRVGPFVLRFGFMTQAQEDAERCGLIPEENPPDFVAKHLSAYAWMRLQIGGMKVLDVGFGDGYGAAYLAEVAREVVGIDVVAGNIPWAQKKYPKPNLIFLHFDGRKIPFPDGTFDAAGAFQVIEHIPEPQIVPWLCEIKRVLKDGGTLYVSTLNVEHARKPGRPYEKLIYHEKEFTAPELEEVLRSVFHEVCLYGLHPTWKHRFFMRLKKWGLREHLPKPINFVKRYYDSITIRDFVVRKDRTRHAMDLIAVCKKGRNAFTLTPSNT